MRTEHLEYLLDIKNTLSLTKTAENFYTSHQVINNAIKSLENELNIKILNRSSTGVTFTEAGLLVEEFANDIINRRRQLNTSIAPFVNFPEAAVHGALDVYIIPRFSNKKFFNFYLNFCSKHKNIDFSIKTMPSQFFYSRLPFEKPFVFLVTLHPEFIVSDAFKNRLSQHALSYKIVSEQQLGYCVSSKSKWYPILSQEDDNMPIDTPFVVFNFAIDEESSMLKNDTQFYTIDSFESQKELIKNGEYVGICTPWEFKKFFQSKNSNLVFLPRELTTPFYYAILFHESLANHLPILEFAKALTEYFT